MYAIQISRGKIILYWQMEQVESYIESINAFYFREHEYPVNF